MSQNFETPTLHAEHPSTPASTAPCSPSSAAVLDHLETPERHRLRRPAPVPLGIKIATRSTPGAVVHHV
jgi:hypothetical protein